MAQMTMTAHHANGESTTATVLPLHRVAFERHFKVPFASLRDEPFEERLLWLGWNATTSGRPNPPTFDVWLETVTSIDLGGGRDESEDEVPLDRTASSGTSLPSPSSPVPGSPSIG